MRLSAIDEIIAAAAAAALGVLSEAAADATPCGSLRAFLPAAWGSGGRNIIGAYDVLCGNASNMIRVVIVTLDPHFRPSGPELFPHPGYELVYYAYYDE